MRDLLVIGIVGLQASGKTVVASNLVKLGASRVRMGDVVWREVENRGLKVNEKNVAKVAKELREEEGMDAIAERCIPLIKEKGKENKIIIVDGIRGIDEVKKFKNEFGENFVLLSVESSENTRYERIKKRGREDDIEDFETFREKDKREKKWGLEEAMESADYSIVNEGTLSELKEKTSKIFKEMKEKYENQSQSKNQSKRGLGKGS